MSNLEAGMYLIVPARNSAPPPFPVGADIQGKPVAPVIAGGKDNIWLVRKNDNKIYALILKVGGSSLISHPGGDDVIVGGMPGPGLWDIQELDGDVYTIVELGPIIARRWTLSDTTPGTRVELRPSESPTDDQLWRFIRLFDE